MIWLNLIPKWLLAALVATLAATSCKLKWDNSGLSIEIEKGKTYVAQLERNISETTAKAAQQTTAMERQVRAAEKAAAVRTAAVRADADRAHTELERLRVALSAYTAPRLTASAASIGPGLDVATAADDLLTVSSRYVALAESCDRHVNDLRTMMEAWPK